MDDTGHSTAQYLTFALDEDIFAINIASVREVLELSHMVSIPKAPGFMRGIINLRGHAVPVVAVRQKFGLPRIPDTVETCVIIVETQFNGTASMMGALVDSVREVVDLKPKEVEEAPTIGTAIKPEFIKGMAKKNERFVTILNIEHIFSATELAEAQPVAGEKNDAPPPQGSPEPAPAGEGESAAPAA